MRVPRLPQAAATPPATLFPTLFPRAHGMFSQMALRDLTLDESVDDVLVDPGGQLGKGPRICYSLTRRSRGGPRGVKPGPAAQPVVPARRVPQPAPSDTGSGSRGRGGSQSKDVRLMGAPLRRVTLRTAATPASQGRAAAHALHPRAADELHGQSSGKIAREAALPHGVQRTRKPVRRAEQQCPR